MQQRWCLGGTLTSAWVWLHLAQVKEWRLILLAQASSSSARWTPHSHQSSSSMLVPPSFCLFNKFWFQKVSPKWVPTSTLWTRQTQVPALLDPTFLWERQTSIKHRQRHSKYTPRWMLGRGRTKKDKKTTHEAWSQRNRDCFCSLASNLDYKLPYGSENPSQGETVDNLGWQLIQLASPWLRVGICICWTNKMSE